MGQNSSSEPIEEEYNIINIREDGSVLLQHKKTKAEHLLRNICSNVQEEINGFSKLLKKREQIKSEHLLNLIQIRKKQEKQICSIIHKLYMIIEYPFKSLKDQIQQKKNSGFIRNNLSGKYVPRQKFTQGELWSILYSCSIGLDCLYKSKFTHQALTSEQIYIDKDGMIKISDPVLLGLEKNYINILKKANKKCYISPQIMNFIEDCNFSFFDKEKSDVFTLGVILLEACLLKQIQIYDAIKKQPHHERIPKYLEEVKQSYSNNFCELLSSMLETTAKMRPKFQEIYQKIEIENSQTENQSGHHNFSDAKYSTAQNFYKKKDVIQPQNHADSQLKAKFQQINRNSFGAIPKQMNQIQFKEKYNYYPENNFQPPSITLPNFPKQSNKSSFNAFENIKIDTTTFRGNPQFKIENHKANIGNHQFTHMLDNSQGRVFFVNSNSSCLPLHQHFSQFQPMPNSLKQYNQNTFMHPQTIKEQNNMSLYQNNNFPYSPPTNLSNQNSVLRTNPEVRNFSIESQIEKKKQSNLFARQHEKFEQKINQQEINKELTKESKDVRSIKINSPQKSPGNLSHGLESHEAVTDNIKQFSSSKSNCSSLKSFQNREYVTLILNQGGKYSGYFQNGMKNGEGKLQFKDGGYYIGQWKNDKMHGYGRLHYQNGNIAYEGQWVNDQFNGIGQVYNDCPQQILGQFNYFDFADLGNKWIYYQGQLKNDSKHGKGLIKLSNHEVFEGNFVYDVIEGEGSFYKVNGQIIKGVWRDNILITN